MDKPDERKSPSTDAREARLAQALRANLRRRKAPARPASAPAATENALLGDHTPNSKDTD